MFTWELRGLLRLLVLRWALRRHVGRDESVRRQRSRQHDLRVVLERVGDDAVVVRAERLAVALDVELIFEAVALLADGARHDVAMDLQLLARPVRLAAHDLIHVLVVPACSRRASCTAESRTRSASTSVVTPILAALWLIDKDFRYRKHPSG